MTPEQLQELKDSLKDALQEKVNGKIDAIHKILETQNNTMSTFHDKVDKHIMKDDTWKEDYTPYIKGLANVSGGARIMVIIALGVSALIGAFLGIKKLF